MAKVTEATSGTGIQLISVELGRGTQHTQRLSEKMAIYSLVRMMGESANCQKTLINSDTDHYIEPQL